VCVCVCVCVCVLVAAGRDCRRDRGWSAVDDVTGRHVGGRETLPPAEARRSGSRERRTTPHPTRRPAQAALSLRQEAPTSWCGGTGRQAAERGPDGHRAAAAAAAAAGAQRAGSAGPAVADRR